MAHSQLSADSGDQISEVHAMADIGDHREVLIINGLPVIPVHFGIVKVLALESPCLAKDLCPFGSWVDEHFKLGDVNRTIANFCRAVGCDYPPPGTGRLVEELLLISRERV